MYQDVAINCQTEKIPQGSAVGSLEASMNLDEIQ